MASPHRYKLITAILWLPIISLFILFIKGPGAGATFHGKRKHANS